MNSTYSPDLKDNNEKTSEMRISYWVLKSFVCVCKYTIYLTGETYSKVL